MSTKNIKIGEIYNVRVKVIGITKDGVDALYVDADGGGIAGLRIGKRNIGILRLSTPETAPKYDPCRLFKKGDKVRVVEWNGRDIANAGKIGHVVSDEYNSRVEIAINGWTNNVYYQACHLELVTPVEELGPYSVRHNEAHAAWSIYGPFGLSAVNYFYGERYPYTQETAKAAAEAECARLNDEHRKENA